MADSISPEDVQPQDMSLSAATTTTAAAAAAAASSSLSTPKDDDETIQLTIHHHGVPQTFQFSRDDSMRDLSAAVEFRLQVPPSNQKFMITPKTGLLKPPFASERGGEMLPALVSKKIVLLGSSASDIASVDTQAKTSVQQQQQGRRQYPIPPAKPSSARRTTQQSVEESIYTFTTLLPLPYLPNPSRSLAYLARLRDDPGIRATMRRNRWTVPVLTEMNPVEHTTHESRTLGLNRNAGQVIELRLRTDAYDGYRDYKTIRNTLCHELAHNVFADHDHRFWALCRQIEREVAAADYRGNPGRALDPHAEFYDPSPPPPPSASREHVNEPSGSSSWSGGEFILGTTTTTTTTTTPATATATPAATATAGTAPAEARAEQSRISDTTNDQSTSSTSTTRRGLLAKAAEERIKRLQQQQQQQRQQQQQ